MADRIDQVIKKLEQLEDEIIALRRTLHGTIETQTEALNELKETVNNKLKIMENEMIGTIKRAG
ncbi:MAG: hypothetical protein KDC07_00800 [Chitinophagaceae bacterium]|nr:hypothetical protein [Chitinophagaceae bacterium]MCB9044624.1 hypothetical protein [Chitinophagales bacterium]